MQSNKLVEINGSRLWRSLMDLAKFGATPKGGVCRLALTDFDKQARDQLIAWGREAGLTIVIDKIGNIFMRRKGEDASLPPIVMGSHIDTQPSGGKFDGNFGVLSGLEVIRTLNEQGIKTKAPLEVAAWTNEEGSRFVPVMMGSGVFRKAFTLEHAYAACDVDGKSAGDELKRIGYIGEQEPGNHPMGAYFEAHIEQGPVLEAENKTIGVVKAVLGLRWYDCVVQGQEAHAGPTPMKQRKDALQAATHIMQEVVAIANRYPPHGRGTVGFVQLFPNSRNVIPGQVKFSVDLRNINDELLNKMDKDIRTFIDKISGQTGLKITLTEVSYFQPTAFHDTCTQAVAKAAAQLGYSHMDTISGAGHDAVYMSHMVPTCMIFIPCKDGISHNEIEETKPEEVTAGCNVLLHAVLELAGQV